MPPRLHRPMPERYLTNIKPTMLVDTVYRTKDKSLRTMSNPGAHFSAGQPLQLHYNQMDRIKLKEDNAHTQKRYGACVYTGKPPDYSFQKAYYK